MSAQRLVFGGLLLGILGLLGASHFLVVVPEDEVSTAVSHQQNVDNRVPAGVRLDCSLSNSYPDSVLQWCGLIELYARENGIDPNLVSAVMLQESGGRPDAYSKSGAVGLLQVMPRDGKSTSFVCKNGPCFTDRPTMSQLFDPEFNIGYGTQMLASLIQKHGNIRDALRAYGPENSGYEYADIVIAIMNRYQ